MARWLERTAAAAAISAAMILASCTGGGTPTGGGPSGSGDQATPLAPSEIREYKGKKLSSVDDFRENSIKGPQKIDKASYRLKVSGLVNKPLTLTYEEVIKKYPHFTKVVTLHCVEGWDVTILWEGVLLKDVLREAGVRPDAKTVIFRARDGYTSSFPVSYFDKDIIMAYKMNGVALPPERGFPFQLVAEDKWGYKWVKWIEGIQVSSDANYRGYWESRGYSNSGDLNERFFGP